MTTALITGASGQTGSYLCELLLSKGYTVYGIVRRNSNFQYEAPRLAHIKDPNFKLIYGDLVDNPSMVAAIEQSMPDEIYNLGSQSDVRISFDIPTYTSLVNAMGAINFFENARHICPAVKIYQASTSELFGNSIDDDGFQRETTPMIPVSPYGASKLFAYNQAKIYRQSYGMYITNGILFNHESPRRGDNFVTNKVVDYATRISRGENVKLPLGNLAAERDWGHAKDYSNAIYEMLQLNSPDDFVVATGVAYNVEHLVKYVFEKLNLIWQDHVVIDDNLYRPLDINRLCGDNTKLTKAINWKHSYTFETLIDEMLEERIVC
jgi:GDPmannose 4,6-dehydratase|tara:strand:- start:187 stop:1152 length:966 start_codon:yes stop_codon:yes gene_type:complete